MIDAIVRFALARRPLAVFATVFVAALGVRAFSALPIEAYPDVADTMVQIISQWPGHAAEEVERQVSLPVELEMSGVPRMSHLRSTSIFGLSVVTLIFEDGTDSYFARQQVVERLGGALLPEGVEPQLGPLASPVGEVYRYVVRGDGYSPADLKAIQDWTLERQIRSVPGVADVIGFGGPVKEYHVLVKPERLAAHGLTLTEVGEALSRSNRNAGGGYLEVGPQAVNVRGLGLIDSPDEILQIAVRAAPDGTPVLVRDVADVEIGHAPRLGIVGIGGDDDVVQATVLMRKGENPGRVTAGVRDKIDEIARSGILPKGVRVVPYYDRTQLTSVTTRTVMRNLVEGVVLVAAVLLAFLGNLRSALVVAVSIPLSLLFAFVCMDAAKIPANLLSIGAVDFGMIVDGAVFMVENVFRRLAAAGDVARSRDRLEVVRAAAREIARPMFFSVAIIVVAYLPVFTLERVEGKLFRPMAFTVAFALVGSLAFALVAAPALSGYVLRGRLREFHNPLLAWRDTLYPRILRWALARRRIVVASAIALAAGGLALSGTIGSEFLPHLDEGAIWVRATLPADVSPSEARPLAQRIRRELLEVPEATVVTSQVGRPDDGTDPTGFYNAEFFVQLRDRDAWRPEIGGRKDRLIEQIAAKLRAIPGVSFGFSQPIADNVEEATSGVKGQLAIKIYGPDLQRLDDLATAIGTLVENVPGVVDFGVLRELGQTNLAVEVDRSRAAQFGVDVSDIEDVIEAGVGGRTVTRVIEGERRFGLVVRMIESARQNIDALRRLPVGGRQGRLVPLGQLATLRYVSGASRIWREDGARYIAVKFGVRDRDLGSTVAEAQDRVRARIRVPEGYRVVWSGEFESQQRANRRLAIIVPLTLAGITALLVAALRSLRDALVVLVDVVLTAPLGGIVALRLTHAHFSVSSGVGLLALFGTSMQIGLLLVSTIDAVRRDGADLDDAIVEACRVRLRPVLMTGLAATLGLVPAAFSRAIGSDSQRPLAIVVVGGLLGGLLLSLVLLPVLYRAFAEIWPQKQLEPVPVEPAPDERR